MSYRPLLDKVRWISAAVVALGHALGMLNDHVHGSQILNVIADMRSPAVIVFFVLSGYLVGGLVLKDFAHFDWRRYAAARFARIYIVLIPAILLTLLIDGGVFHFDRLNPLFSQVWQGGALGSTAVFDRYSVARAVASVLCLEPLVAEPIGSAGSFWSLGNEWIYYFAFPALLAVGKRLGGFTTATTLALASVVLVALVSRFNAAFWLVWLAGAFANRADLSRLLKTEARTRAMKATAAFTGICAIVFSTWLGMHAYILIIGLAGFVVLACGPTGESRTGVHVDKALARFSYSLYVTHLQLMTLCAAILFRLNLLPLTGIVSPLRVVSLALGMLIVAMAVAYGFALLFEDRTASLARWLNGVHNYNRAVGIKRTIALGISESERAVKFESN